jgi:CRP-like cAMP-binding protein
MTLQKDVEILRNIPLFAKIDPARLKLLAFTSEHLTFAEGDELFHQGDIGDAAYIILRGRAEVLVDTPNGPVKVADLGENEILGEIAILCDVPRTATVRAVSELAALRIAKDAFFNLTTQFPEVGVEIMQELATRLYQTTQQLTEVSLRLRRIEAGSASG